MNHLKLPQELIFLVNTDMDQFMTGGWQGRALRFLGSDIREIQVRFFMSSVFGVIKELHMISEAQFFNW